MEPLSIAANVVGVTAPALHGLRLLLDDIHNIVDAPDAVATLRGDLLTIDKALTSLQAITEPQWESLGQSVIQETKSAIDLCSVSCDRLRTALTRWTRHSRDGKLSWRDRATVGFLKQSQMKSLSEQLQACKTTLNSVVGIATLHSSLQQKSASEDLLKVLSSKEAEITSALEAANKQLAEVNAQLATLRLDGQTREVEAEETLADTTAVLNQVSDEKTTLITSRKVLQALLDATRAVGAVNARTAPPQPFAAIPFSRDPGFVNRGDIVDRIHQKSAKPPRRVALVGLGGVGKSQLAIEYAHQVAEKGDGWVFWIHAETRGRVEEGFRTIADTVQLSDRDNSRADIPRLVHNWLSNPGYGTWLIIVDSADDRDVFYGRSGDTPDAQPLASYLPQCGHGSILITTRDKDLAFRVTGSHDNMIDVGPMSKENAFTLLETRLSSLPEAEKKAAAELVDALERIPLAISQAAAYIHQRAPRSSVSKYLHEFQEGERKRVKLLAHDAGDLRRGGGASNSILTTWRISFERIRSERPSAADLLSLMSFFDRQGISEDLLKPSDQVTGRENSEESDSDGSDEETDDTFEDDIAMLRDYCLVNVNGAGDMFEMHGLVQLSTRRWLQECGLEQRFRQKFIELMAKAFPTPYYNYWATCRRLFAHVRAAAEYKPPVGGDEERAWATLLYHGGWYASSEGNYTVAERMLRKSSACFQRSLGQDAEATLTCQSVYANVLGIQGRFDEAEKLQTQTLETLQCTLGPHHGATMNSRNWLTSLYWKQGRYQELDKLTEQTLETCKTLYGEASLTTQAVAVSLGLSHVGQGKAEEAKAVILAALRFYREKLGPHSPATLSLIGNLVAVLNRLGEWEEAHQLGVEALEAHKTHLGRHHPLTLVAMAHLGITLRRQGLLKEAEELHSEVWEARKSALGTEHSETLNAMHDLACTWYVQGRDTEAAELMRDCIALRQRVLGPEHPDTEMSVGCLRRWEEAEDTDGEESTAGSGD